MDETKKAQYIIQNTVNEMAMSQIKIIAHACNTLFSMKEQIKPPKCRSCDNCLLYDCQAYYYDALENLAEEIDTLEP